MYNCRNKSKNYNSFKNNLEEVVKMVAIPGTIDANKLRGDKSVETTKKKKKSALEISDSIGVYGAFGRTLADLHKQGR